MRKALGSIFLLLFLAVNAASAGVEQGLDSAIFAGGCFWCMEPPFEKIQGVISVTAGYTGGEKDNPSYEEVSAGGTGHAEAVEIRFDPSRVSYEKLLEVFWINVDPTVNDRQFCDKGRQYRPGIFYRNEAQKKAAEASVQQAQGRLKAPGRIVVEITPASRFYPAEGYHQDYYKRNPIRYKFYRRGCGRDKRLKELWGVES
ncbi:MAG: peptide-methionine (S)-S-oxide reductase MsrA [Elusimicrobia bacterium]|nr:peptide-methionine (S)-S-oxide reductase MsrA [Elusimicrobiota bacterium]